MSSAQNGRSLLLVPVWEGQPSREELARQAAEGVRARQEYVALADGLDAEIMDWSYFQTRATPVARAVARRAGYVPAQIAEAYVRRNRYANIVLKADKLGLPLALIHKLTRARRDLVLISVWISRGKKAMFVHPLGAHSHFKSIVFASSAQMEIARQRLGVPAHKAVFAPQPADERFWKPDGRPVENLICSVGSEQRDYRTLVEAVRGVDVRAEIAVGGIVLRTGNLEADLSPALGPLISADLPPNVEVRQQLDHQALRDMYARSKFVVVPTEDVDFDAGVTVIAEAMAMGKAVIVTRTFGQRDLVREGETGLHVPPGDPRALREAIERLLRDPAEAERMGRAARAFAEEHLRLDDWVAKVVAATRGRA
jgi:glycosyltransferase involved in cell wall biosynthesis